MSNLNDSLENCLKALAEGQSIDSVLAGYPDLAGELRPLLETARLLRHGKQLPVPTEIQRRARARLLQRASEMRATRLTPRKRMIPIFPRLAITLGLVGVLALTSTGLVSASSGSLPGEQLYPVKRTWEQVRLWLVSNPGSRELLESEYEQERLNEIDELLGRHQSAPIMFSGLVIKQQDGRWLVSGIPVSVTTSTHLPTSNVTDGAPVVIVGTTRSDGVVEAQQVQLLQPGSALPPFEPSENETEENGEELPNGISIPSSSATSQPAQPEPQQNESGRTSYQYTGVVESMVDGVWHINGQPVYVDQAGIKGNVTVGSRVEFEGYYGQDGKFVVTTVQIVSDSEHRDSSDGGSDGQQNPGGDSGGEGSNGGGGGETEGGED